MNSKKLIYSFKFENPLSCKAKIRAHHFIKCRAKNTVHKIEKRILFPSSLGLSHTRYDLNDIPHIDEDLAGNGLIHIYYHIAGSPLQRANQWIVITLLIFNQT